ncbi:MAG: nitroreductase [Verrucomicrobia bacterium]|nr:nitroreductase [Verrucomicrobiota bacterium]
MKSRPQFDHDIHELLRARWSPRAFTPKPVEPEIVLRLFEAARWAASANNEQPWRFIQATQEQPELYKRLFDCLVPANQEWVKTAPLLVMTVVRVVFDSGKPNRWAFHDLGLAVGNLTTQATSMGLYVHNMAGFSVDKARQTFALPPELEPVTMIAIGYLGDPAQLSPRNQERELAVQQRKPLSELLLIKKPS